MSSPNSLLGKLFLGAREELYCNYLNFSIRIKEGRKATLTDSRLIRKVKTALKECQMAYLDGGYMDLKTGRVHWEKKMPTHAEILACRFLTPYERVDRVETDIKRFGKSTIPGKSNTLENQTQEIIIRNGKVASENEDLFEELFSKVQAIWKQQNSSSEKAKTTIQTTTELKVRIHALESVPATATINKKDVEDVVRQAVAAYSQVTPVLEKTKLLPKKPTLTDAPTTPEQLSEKSRIPSR
ncbi:hypothetical protein B0J13DRAFT_615449 [Dactylonectria estremocensis]|uniref:Uncharacterized protein n=1 Tax=Dactylonectria estremocensis TaxID=1079267 RepID=A0A9P9JDU8_9HYPO|nr:hypothetical protein B0J13DRAFT_615449 [Dactylonectria estremocensis]